MPTFTVKDIEAARAHLESLDTRFDGDTYEIDGMVKLATFYDPDGNAWMLAQRLDTDERRALVELEQYTFVLLRRPPDAPDYPEERLDEIQEQHLAHLAELHERGVLLLAGPFGDQPDESLRGLCVMTTGVSETRALMANDPAVEAGGSCPRS